MNKKVKYGYDYVKFTWLRMWTVTKDVDELKAAIVYPGGPERWWALPTFGEYPLAWGAKGTPCGYFTRWESEQQRRDLKDTMYQTVKDVLPSVKLFDFKDLLQEALDEYRDDKTALKNIVSTCFGWDWPRIEKLLGDSWKNLTASQIIGQDCPILKHGDGFKVGIRPVPWINNISEQGWMTSDGFIINNKQSWWRSREEEIMKAILEYHPVMKENVHVLLDMGTKDGCYLEGGDCCATSDDSTAITVGWHTNKEAAIEVSKALPDQTIYVVHKYPIEKYGFNGMVFAFGWHRDDIFAMVDENKVLCTPYIFDWPKGGRKWLIKLLKTLRKDIQEWHPILRRYREAGKEIPEWLMSRIVGDFTDEKIEALKDVGTVEIYKNGKRVATKGSLLDALIEDEILEPDNIIYVGGHPDDYADPMEHFFVAFAREEGASPNCAENLKPGVIICHEACERTIKALKNHGVKAVTYKAFYQQKFVGPCQNCCFIPLWRE